MKIIIDANVASEFDDKAAEAKAIVSWLRSRGTLSTGGLNLSELNKTKIRTLIIELIRAGRGTVCLTHKIDAALLELKKVAIASNDPHVLALAIAGGARLIYTHDAALIEDFRNKTIIDKPRGSCYSHAERHKHLLS